MRCVITFSAYISSEITINGRVYKSDRNSRSSKLQRELGGGRSVCVSEENDH